MTPQTSLFMRAVRGEPVAVPPIWLMRQAGRYHRHYQKLRAAHSFLSLCREPELAAEVTMGPIDDFDFDAAILFSDLLFPLEALGFGLSYDPSPKLDGSLDAARIAQFRPTADALPRLQFQREAMAAVRARLPQSKGLIGFVGGPWTLFVYAVEGTHAGRLERAKSSPALYRAFADRLVPLLIENIRLQFDGGADIVMIFDTAAGELSPEQYADWTARDLAKLAAPFPGQLGYYARGTNRPRRWTPEVDLGQVLLAQARPVPLSEFAGIGLDWTWDLPTELRCADRRGFLQGNFDPAALAADHSTFAAALGRYLEPLRALDAGARRGWICGLGHGVLQTTPEDNVRAFVNTVREAFA